MAAKKIKTASAFTIGSVLGRSFTLLSRRTGIFLALAFLSLLPGAIFQSYGFDRTGLGFGLINLFVGMLVQGGVAYTVFRVMTGDEHISFGEAVSHGTSRALPLMLTAILAGFGVGFGLMLFVIPGLILLCAWSLVVPCCVVERLGPVESIKRSARLTKGHRMQIFAIAFLSALLAQFAARLAVWLAAVLFPASLFLFTAVILLFALLLPQAYTLIVFTTAYYDLRTVKEGVPLERLEISFD
ncbi:hypothetical protein LJC31_05025 [Synergistaceae bacterium OttesenSCG-928-I11]|nr:hypothetical protein [Synergistaceae bacterium OttesenSCG-928-I11]